MSNIGHGFSAASLNVRSLLANGEKVESFLETTKLDILAIQEVWKADDEFSGYNYTDITRKNKRGGGVAFLVKKEHDFKVTNKHIDKNVEFITIRIKDRHFTSVYLPPNNNLKEGLATLERSINHKKNVFILGDFNINLNIDSFTNSEASPTERLHDFNRNIMCYPLIRNPTRITKTTVSTIDNIITNEKNDVISGVLTAQVADHLSPFVIIKDKQKKSNTSREMITVRNMAPENIQKLREDLQATNWDKLLESNDINEKTDTFATKLKELLDKNCELKTIKFNKNKHAKEPWMTAGLLRSRARKDKLYFKWVKSRLPAQFDEYKLFQSLFNKVKKESRQLHYKQLYEDNYKDSRKLWQVTNTILNRKQRKDDTKKLNLIINGTNLTNDNEIAEAFNTHFVSIGKTLAEKFPTNENYMQHMTTWNGDSLKFREMNDNDFDNIIKIMKAKKSTGFDEISNKLIKEVYLEIRNPMTHLINTSIKESTVPIAWKTAKVIPLHKGGKKEDKNNYRPISLLSALSKILEKFIHKQVYDFVEGKILCATQFGFRKKCETSQAIMNFMKNIEENNSEKYHVSIFVDIKKAFDSVNHAILIKKLECLGIKGKEKKWFENYLKDRKQITIVNGKASSEKLLDTGVPQGSILGPLLFLLYINDMPNATNLLTTLFADDTTYQLSGNCLRKIEELMNYELGKIANWFDDNHLTLHPGKTRYIIYQAGRKIAEDINLNLKGVPIQRVGNENEETGFKFLGLWLDEKLNWKLHIEKVLAKTRKITYTIIKLKKYLPAEHIAMIYKGLIKPIFEYGLSIWGHKRTKELNRSHKKIIRIMNSMPQHTHAEPLLKQMNILQLDDLYKLRVVTALNKVRNGEAPNILANYCEWNDLESRRWFQIKTPCRVNAITRSLPQYEQINVWNKFFTEQTALDIDSYTTKKLSKKWKQDILSSYYNECDLSKCYSCRMQLIFLKERMKKQEERSEEIRKANYERTERINKILFD